MAGMLEGKSMLVTGAAGGMGRAAAVLFAREGAKVAVADVKDGAAQETAEMASAEGGEVIFIRADMTARADVDAMIRTVVDSFGRLDGAFNNAGITGGQVGQGGKFTADWEEEAWDRIVTVNAKGVWHCMQAEIRQMLTQDSGGAIVNTSSLAGITGFLTTTGYAASKHAVVGMTKTAALEYAPKIRVNALCPGYVDTDLLSDTMSRRGEAILAKIPFKRLAQPIELAEMACWLLSDRASYTTGGTFVVDGGFMAGSPT